MARPTGPVNKAAFEYRGAYGGCWEWTGGTNRGGYGVAYGSGPRLVHRLVFAALFGPIPADLYVLHRCDNPPCFRPEHLFLGTLTDNNRDMRDKGRHWCLARDTCGNGHPWTPENTTYRLQRGTRARSRVCLQCLRDRSVQGVKRKNVGRSDLLCPAGFQRHRYLGADVCFKCGTPRPVPEPKPRSLELRQEIARTAARARWQR